MTKEDIEKALEICSKDEDCEKCPYRNHYRCDRALLKDALVLIIEQEKEIDQLKLDLESEKYRVERLKKELADKDLLIEQL